MRYIVRHSKHGKTFDVIDTHTDAIVEGGFFSRRSAQFAADVYNQLHYVES